MLKQTFDKKKDPDSLDIPDHQGHSLFLIAFHVFTG